MKNILLFVFITLIHGSVLSQDTIVVTEKALKVSGQAETSYFHEYHGQAPVYLTE